MLEGYVVRQQDIRSVSNRIAFGQGLSGAEFVRSRAHREIQLRRRTSKDTRRPLPDDGNPLHHGAVAVYAPVGRRLPEVTTVTRGEKNPDPRGPASRSSTLQ